MNNYYSQWNDLDESEDSFIDDESEMSQDDDESEMSQETGCCSGCERCLL